MSSDANDKEMVLCEKRVLLNAIQYIGKRGTGDVPLEVAAQVVAELQAAFAGRVLGAENSAPE